MSPGKNTLCSALKQQPWVQLHRNRCWSRTSLTVCWAEAEHITPITTGQSQQWLISLQNPQSPQNQGYPEPALMRGMYKGILLLKTYFPVLEAYNIVCLQLLWLCNGFAWFKSSSLFGNKGQNIRFLLLCGWHASYIFNTTSCLPGFWLE